MESVKEQTVKNIGTEFKRKPKVESLHAGYYAVRIKINGEVAAFLCHEDSKGCIAELDSPAAQDLLRTVRPVAGKDTPAADDIITQCAGGCGEWMVGQHPSHILGGARLNPETGQMEKYGPLSDEEIAIEVARMEQGGSSCLSCGPIRSAS